MSKILVKGVADTGNAVTGKVDHASAPDTTKSIAALAKVLGLAPSADASTIRAAVDALLKRRGIEAGARQLGLSPKAAKALAAMPERRRR